MVNDEFTQLCSRAWSLRILSYLGQGGEARISPMAHTLSTGRTAITASVENLIDLEYVRRTSGHGHPLRPAFELTRKSYGLADWAVEIDDILSPQEWRIAARTWSLPVMRLTDSAPRFGELRSALSPVTDRALSQTLKLLTAENWLSRTVDTKAAPPQVSYTANGMGEVLLPCLEKSFRL